MTSTALIEENHLASSYEKDFDDLVWGRRAGHMGHHEFFDTSMPLWARFLNDNKDQYYIPANESALIKKASKLSASLLGNKPVTLVTRGCGTKFLEKEGVLIRSLMNVVGVVYIDRSDAALKQSMDEGRTLLPNAWHVPLQADIYDPLLRYPVEGVEVGTSFGLTLMNFEGFPSEAITKDAYIENITAIRAQMAAGSHFITVFDHNENRASIERAYAGQTDFAKHMLKTYHSLDTDLVDFVVKFYPQSHILAHGFRFRENTVVSTLSGDRRFFAGDVLWFNNSVKPPVEAIKQWNKAGGFAYVRMDIPRDAQNYLGWHHLVKA